MTKTDTISYFLKEPYLNRRVLFRTTLCNYWNWANQSFMLISSQHLQNVHLFEVFVMELYHITENVQGNCNGCTNIERLVASTLILCRAKLF